MHGHSGTVYLCFIWLYLNKTNNAGQPPYLSTIELRLAGCGKTRFTQKTWKSPSSASDFRNTLVEPLSEARTPLADFFSILLDCNHSSQSYSGDINIWTGPNGNNLCASGFPWVG